MGFKVAAGDTTTHETITTLNYGLPSVGDVVLTMSPRHALLLSGILIGLVESNLRGTSWPVMNDLIVALQSKPYALQERGES